MNDSTDKWSRAKQEFYARPEVAEGYDEQRFGGASGAWVDAREIELVRALASPFRRVLDLACGTGRVSRALAGCGETVGVDSSAPMLAAARRAYPAPFIQADAFRLPFAEGSFDGVIALRFVFHFRDLGDLLREARRVVAPGGFLVCDTILWSPRTLLPLDRSRWGSAVFAHAPAQVECAAQQSGWRAAQQTAAFLFSPYVYRRLPLPIVQWLARAETHVPARMRARMFWGFERAE